MSTAKTNYKYLDILVVLFVASLIVSNIVATKLISFGPIIVDGGAVLFPFLYILGDIITEVYGFKYARRAIWLGFGTMILAVVCITIVGFLPPAVAYGHQLAYETVLGFVPRIVLASLMAYLVGGLLNSYILVKIKQKTKGKKLWLRLLGSTAIGELFDTVVFCLIAFGGIISNSEMFIYIGVGWVFKNLVEVAALPLCYRVISILKRRENTDSDDKKTNFNPFKISV